MRNGRLRRFGSAIFGLAILFSACTPRVAGSVPPDFPIPFGKPWTASIEGRTFTFSLRQDVTSPESRRLSFYVFRGTDTSGNTVEAEMFRGTGIAVRIYEQRFDKEIFATTRAYVCYAKQENGRWVGHGLYGSLLQEADVVTLPSFTSRPPNCELKPGG